MQKRFGLILTLLSLFSLLAVETMPAWAELVAQEGQTIQICTTDGIKTVSIDENGLAREQQEDKSSEHCPLCVLNTAQSSQPTTVLSSFIFTPTRLKNFYSAADRFTPQIKYNPTSPRDPPLTA
jgi:hypothetical protein